MRADEIRVHLRRELFRPIRVYISDGSSYDVRHPELMFVTRTEVVIALDPGNDEIPERSVIAIRCTSHVWSRSTTPNANAALNAADDLRWPGWAEQTP